MVRTRFVCLMINLCSSLMLFAYITESHENINSNKKKIRIEGHNSRFLQSPHCAMNHLQHIHSSGKGAITCNTSSANHVQHVMCHFVWRDSSAVKFDRADIALVYFSLLARTIKRWRRGGNWSTQRKPLMMRFRTCHILNSKNSSPNRDVQATFK